MKIWLITSSLDNLYLFRFLNEYNFSYHIYYDQEGGHRWDKTPAFVEQRIRQWLDYLLSQWIEKCILPPIWELVFLKIEKYQQYIIPLFSSFVLEQVLPWSRIGKIWLLGDWSDLQHQQLLKDLCITYVLNDNQQSTKNFHQPLQYWSKELPLRKYFMVLLSQKNWMIHNVVKHDMRYFLDAWVDTLIPCNYWYFAFDVTLAKYVHTKKCRWYKLEKIACLFANIAKNFEQKTYSVTIHHTGTIAHLQAEKKWMWILQKGKQVDLTIIAL